MINALTHAPRQPMLRRVAAPLVFVVVCFALLLPLSAREQSAADLYAQAFGQEATVRARAAAAALADLRGVASAYEAVVLRFPASAYSDNALWRAAGLCISAFERFSDPADEQRAQQLLERLQKEYSSSSLVKKAAESLEHLRGAAPQQRPDAKPPAAQAPPAAGSPATLRAITRTPLPRGERVTVEFTQEVGYVSDRIPTPDRVYFDFRNATMPASIGERAPSGTGPLIKALRLAPRDARTTRLVLDLTEAPRYSVFRMYDPFRLVIDVETDAPLASAAAPPVTAAPPVAMAVVPLPPPVTSPAPSLSESVAPPAAAPKRLESDPAQPLALRDATKAATADTPAPPGITSRGDYSLARQLGLGISRIVIDPGHGGHDPGAQANGIDEAELVLDVALRVEKLLLDESGFDVVLTRRTDDYVPLEERTAIANRDSADLFLSIHANASKEAAVRGIETYFLNFASNPTAEAVAARENASSVKTMNNLPELVKAITLNNKVEESREMATIVQSSLTRRLATPTRTVRDLGVKQAPFVVLIGAQMPSVLAEISFVTNQADAALLKQDAYRQKIAQALFDAVVKYRGSLKKTAVVATRGNGK